MALNGTFALSFFARFTVGALSFSFIFVKEIVLEMQCYLRPRLGVQSDQSQDFKSELLNAAN